MRYLLAVLTVMLTFSILGFADEQTGKKAGHNKMDHSKMDHKDGKKHDHSKDSEASSKNVGKGKFVITVKGMVCDFCAQGIEKNFGKREEVKSTKVDLDKMIVTVQLKDGKSMDEKTIAKIIKDAGFKYVGLKNE